MANNFEVDPYVNPGYLDILEVANQPGMDFLKLRVPADGNCAFYSFALGLINLIILDKYTLSKNNYQLLAWQFHSRNQKDVIDSRRKFYDTGIQENGKRVRLKGVSERLLNLQEALMEERLNSFEQFKYYLHSNKTAFVSVCGTAIFLAHALRALSAKALSQNKEIVSANITDQDGENAEFDQLAALAKLLDLDLIVYDAKLDSMRSTKEGLANPSTRPQIALIFEGDQLSPHYNFLITKDDYSQPPYYFAFPNSFKKSDPLKLLHDRVMQEKNKFHSVKFREFRDYLRNLENEVRELKNPVEIDIGNHLLSVLRNNANPLFGPQPAKQAEALRLCHQTLGQAQREFEGTKRKSLCNLLANLGLFLLGLGVIYLALGTLHYLSTGRFSFFNKPSLDKALPQFSQQLLRCVEETGLARDSHLDTLTPVSAWSSLKF